MRTPAQDGFVYFMQCEATGRIKIGWTSNVKKRLEALNSGSSTKIVLLTTFPGSMLDESKLHSKFAADQVDGLTSREWFYHTTAIDDLVRSFGGDPEGTPVLAERTMRFEADGFFRDIAQVEALVIDLLTIMNTQRPLSGYRHAHGERGVLSSKFTQDIWHLRNWLKPAVADAVEQQNARIREKFSNMVLSA